MHISSQIVVSCYVQKHCNLYIECKNSIPVSLIISTFEKHGSWPVVNRAGACFWNVQVAFRARKLSVRSSSFQNKLTIPHLYFLVSFLSWRRSDQKFWQKIPPKNEESPLPVDVFIKEVHVQRRLKGDQVGRNLGTGYYLSPWRVGRILGGSLDFKENKRGNQS